MAIISPPRHIAWSTDRLDLADPFQRKWYIRQVIEHGKAEDVALLDSEFRVRCGALFPVGRACHHPKTVVTAPAVGSVPEAAGAASVPANQTEGSTPHRADPFSRWILSAIIHSIRVGPVKAAGPLPDVAGQVQRTVRAHILGILSNRGRMSHLHVIVAELRRRPAGRASPRPIARS